MNKKILIQPLFLLLSSVFFGVFIPNPIYGWTVPVQISGSGINNYSHVATSVMGNAEAVWVHGVAPYTIESSSYSLGSWSSPVAITLAGNHFSPQVAIDQLGNTVAVWLEISGSNYLIQAATKPVAGSWSLPTTLSTMSNSSEPKIAMNNNSQAIVIWTDYALNLIQVSHLTFGGIFSAPITISTLPQQQSNPLIGIDDNGDGYAVWEADSEDLYTAESNGLIWNSPSLLHGNGTNTNPSLSVSGIGRALVAWSNFNLNEIRSDWYVAPSWSKIPSVISPIDVSAPAAAAFMNHGFVTWQDQNTGLIQAINYNATEWVHPPVNVSTSLFNDVPVISVESSSTAAISWINQATGDVQTVQFPNGGVVGPEQIVSTGSSNFNLKTASSGTQTVLTWTNADTVDYIIYANVD